MLTPLSRIIDRVSNDHKDSDSAYFSSLMYLGEMVTKLVVAGMAAAINNDKDQLRYSQLHALVRAGGIGEWAKQLDQILTGPPSQFLNKAAYVEQRELTEKVGPGTWQYDAVCHIHECCKVVQPDCEPLPGKPALTRAFHQFAQLRNKSPRGHGATTHEDVAAICPALASGMKLIVENFTLFSRQWVHLHRNLSGKYRVTSLSSTDSEFDYLRKSKSEVYGNGVHVFFDSPCAIDLAFSDVGANDFFLANGGYTQKQHEFISYITGETLHRDSTPYHRAATALPQSETEGAPSLDTIGSCFTNIPKPPAGIVSRPELEQDLTALLTDERHEIVTLVGSGGIGKTTLSLEVLHRLAQGNRYELIVWFSARDIELTTKGPKQVRTNVLDAQDISREYAKLLQPTEKEQSAFDSVSYFSDELTKNSIGPTLFVFDNFETVSNPLELYKWLDTYIRPPNKILITTRFRDFKGDYPIEVRGMTETECAQLIEVTSRQFGINELITGEYTQKLVEESDGHPYVLKILLGEVAKQRKLVPIQRVMAGKEEILTALFERTYRHLSPAAQRTFLTLANWHSTIPLLAVQAVLLRLEHDKIDVVEAVERLAKSSFVEILRAEQDEQEFIHVPSVAAVFGRGKLRVSPYRAAVEADTKLLHEFGAAKKGSITRGIKAHIKRFIAFVANEDDELLRQEYIQILEGIANNYPPAWLEVAELYGEIEPQPMLDAAKAAVQQYLEHTGATEDVLPWKRLADYCQKSEDLMGELHALVELARLEGIELYEISDSANRFNKVLANAPDNIERDEKRILVEKIADAFEARIGNGTATDRSRLAWLFLHLNNVPKAQRHVAEGLELEPDNAYCLKLKDRLETQNSL